MKTTRQRGVGEIAMNATEFRLIREVINERSGLVFNEDSAFLLERRLRARLAALKFASFTDYHRYLCFDEHGEDEMQKLYDAITTKETYFFREEYQFRTFRESLLPVLCREGAAREQLACWSAGCSTGEEAYSIAIILLESGLFPGWDLRVYGSDISRRNLAVARRGVYPEASFRVIRPDVQRKYFTACKNGFQVSPLLRRICHFVSMNLIDIPATPSHALADAVFCRNVLIYLDTKSRRTVVLGLFERLRPGGFLLLGHSESLINEETPFEMLRLGGDILYRKPNPQKRRPSFRPPSPRSPSSRPPSRSERRRRA